MPSSASLSSDHLRIVILIPELRMMVLLSPWGGGWHKKTKKKNLKIQAHKPTYWEVELAQFYLNHGVSQQRLLNTHWRPGMGLGSCGGEQHTTEVRHSKPGAEEGILSCRRRIQN